MIEKTLKQRCLLLNFTLKINRKSWEIVYVLFIIYDCQFICAVYLIGLFTGDQLLLNEHVKYSAVIIFVIVPFREKIENLWLIVKGFEKDCPIVIEYILEC